MADLDEFFAKKDKKKGKAKKFVIASPPVPPIVDKEIEEVQRQTSEPAKPDVGIDIPTAPTQDNDWKEENVPTQDFEGLKIQPLRTEDIVREDEKKYSEPEEEAVTMKGESVKIHASPWQTKVEQQAPLPPPSEGPVGAYVPPSRRQQPQKGPPDILNPQAFPSLQASVQVISQNKDKTSDKDFQKVRSKSGKSQDFAPRSIELTNKFDALQEN